MVARDTRHAVAGEPTRPREARGSGEEGGVWSGRRAHPTHRPHTRGEDARSRAQPLKSTRDTARRPPPRAGTRGGARQGPSPLLRTPPPRREPARPGGPGSRAGDPRGPGHTAGGRPTRPQAPVRPPTPEGRGMPGGEDTAAGPREADRGARPALGRAHRSGGRGGGGCWGGREGGHRCSPLARPATMSADRRRRQSRQRIGAAAGPGKRDTPGRGPGEQQMGSGTRRAGGRRGAPTGRGGGVRPRDTNATEPAVEAGVAARATARGMASKRPAGGGEASRPLGRTAGSHRQRPPSTGAVPRHTQDDRLASPATTHTHTRTPTHPRGGEGGARGKRCAPPHGASRPPPPATWSRQPARENALPPRTGGPHAALTRATLLCTKGSPAPPPSQGSEGTAPPGDATSRQRPGDDTHVRRGQLGPRPWGNRGGRGTQAVARTGRGGRPAAVGRGRQAHAQQGAAGQGRGRRPGTRKHRDTAGPPGKPARDPTATHTRGRSRDAWDAGRSWPSPERAPHPGPAAARAGVPSTHFPPSIRPSHPSVRPQQIRLPPTSDPEAQHPGDTLSSEAAQTGPTQHRHRLRLGSEGGHDRRLLLTTAAGLGEPGPTRRRAPHIPPFPLGSHHGGRPRTHGTHTAPPLAGHPAGPSGTLPQLGGGGGAGRSRQTSSAQPHRGAGTPIAPLSPRRGGGLLPTCSSSRHSGPTAHTQEGQRLGAPVPQGSLSDR